MKLSKEQEVYKEALLHARQTVTTLKTGCTHIIFPLSEGEEHEMAGCEICHKSFGWKCPKSPDRICHYDDETETDDSLHVELLDGTKGRVPPHSWKGHGQCIFCGQPDERK